MGMLAGVLCCPLGPVLGAVGQQRKLSTAFSLVNFKGSSHGSACQVVLGGGGGG